MQPSHNACKEAFEKMNNCLCDTHLTLSTKHASGPGIIKLKNWAKNNSDFCCRCRNSVPVSDYSWLLLVFLVQPESKWLMYILNPSWLTDYMCNCAIVCAVYIWFALSVMSPYIRAWFCVAVVTVNILQHQHQVLPRRKRFRL